MDNSGTLDADELKLVIKDLGENPSKAEVLALKRKLDVDRSGTVSFDEFVNGMIIYAQEIKPNSNQAKLAAVTQKNFQASANADDEGNEVDFDFFASKYFIIIIIIIIIIIDLLLHVVVILVLFS